VSAPSALRSAPSRPSVPDPQAQPQSRWFRANTTHETASTSTQSGADCSQALASALLAVRVLCFFLCSRCFCLCSLLPEAHRLRLRACLCHLTCTSGRGASSRVIITAVIYMYNMRILAGVCRGTWWSQSGGARAARWRRCRHLISNKLAASSACDSAHGRVDAAAHLSDAQEVVEEEDRTRVLG